MKRVREFVFDDFDPSNYKQLVHCNWCICLIAKTPVGTTYKRKSHYKAGKPKTNIPSVPVLKPVKCCQWCFMVETIYNL